MKKTLFFLLSFLLSITVMAQTKTISGRIVDVKNEPLIGATVTEVGVTGNGTITDIDGKFTLKIKSGTALQVSYIGYLPQKIDIKNETNFNVVLKEDSRTLDEIVVTGYGGKQQRTKVTNSIAKVNEDALSTGIHSNPAQALSGAVAGLQVVQTSGDPGATPTIILRGGTNFDGSGSPLILIDGQVRASLGDINPEDIESMEVLKDAGATAIYGARANNGVVLVTTKRGKKGSAVVNVKAKVGFNYFNNAYGFMNAGDYLYWQRTAYKNANVSSNYTKSDGTVVNAALTNPDGTPVKAWSSLSGLTTATPYGTGNVYWDDAAKTIPRNGNLSSSAIWSTMKYTPDLAFLLSKGWQTMTDPVYGDKLIYKNFNIADVNLNSPSKSQDYNINVSGGNDKGNYYAGLGYNNSEGNAIDNWYKRTTFQFNGDYKVKEWLTSSSNFNLTDVKWYGLPPTQTAAANYFSRGLSLPPTFRGYNEAGQPLLGPNASDGNQDFQVSQFTQDNNTDKFTMGQSFKIDITKGLSLKLSGLWYMAEDKEEAFTKDYLSSPGTYNRARSTSAYYDRQFDQTYNAVLNYDRQITKDHYLSAMLGYEYYDSTDKGFSASGSGAPTSDFGDLALTSTLAGLRSIDSWHSENNILSYFGRVNYDYQSKYLLSLVVRRDGYSRLSTENRFGNFPGISTGWVFSKEKFMDSFSNILSFGKLRASYGRNGNVSKDWVGPYTVQGSYGSSLYNNNVGYGIGSIANPYLTWETSNTSEVGLDLSFLNNKVSVNLTYYSRDTYNKFANITVPSVSGVSTVVSNNGEIHNNGFEYELAFHPINTKNFKWNLSLLGAYNKNTITKLPDNGMDLNRQNAFQVWSGADQTSKIWVGGYQQGQEPGDIYLFKAVGIYKKQSDIPADLIDITSGNNGSNGRALYGGAAGYAKLTAAQKLSALPIRPGDVIWKDVNGDGIIDNYDMVKVGNATPHWTGGFTTNFSYKGIKLDARFDYALGFTVVDIKTPWIMGDAQGTYNSVVDTKATWTPDNPNAKYPTYNWADQLGARNYCRSTSMFAYNGNYLAIRELTLSYSLPKSILRKVLINNAELSVTGQNLGYLTAAKHIFSPEQSANNNGGYPLPTSVIFGVNVSF